MKQEREPFLRKKTGVILLRVSWGWYPTRYRFPLKPQDQLDIASCAAHTYGTWIETLTPNYILGASSQSPYCWEKNVGGLSVLWSTSCPDTRKFAFRSPNVEMAAHFPFPRFFAVYRIRFLKNAAFLTKKRKQTDFLYIPIWGMNTTIPDMPSAVKPLWTGTKRNELGKAWLSNNGTLIDAFFYGTRNRFLPISATASSSPQTLSCFRKIFAIRLQRGNCQSDKCDT